MIDVGRICMKTAGREAGKFCVILDVLPDGFVMVTGPKAATRVKRRKCNIHHIEPTPETLKIRKNASDDEVIAAYKKEGLFKKLGVKEPDAKDIEKAKEDERKRATGAKAAKEKPKAEPKKEKPETKEHEPEKEEKPEPKAEKKQEKTEPKSEKSKEGPAEKKPAVKKAVKKKAVAKKAPSKTKKPEPKKKARK